MIHNYHEPYAALHYIAPNAYVIMFSVRILDNISKLQTKRRLFSKFTVSSFKTILPFHLQYILLVSNKFYFTIL